jgi:hypothetical protein
MALPLNSTSLTTNLRRDFLHMKDLTITLREFSEQLAQENIPFAVIGALAMRQYGYVRFTEDIDIVTTPGGLELIHQRLIGRGLLPRAPGLRKKLKNTVHQVNIDVIQSGEHAGSPESPIIYPAPSDAAFILAPDGVRYASLPSLITFKLASGLFGRRLRDFADVQALIKANDLPEDFAAGLPVVLKEKFQELFIGAYAEHDIE